MELGILQSMSTSGAQSTSLAKDWCRAQKEVHVTQNTFLSFYFAATKRQTAGV